MAKQAYKAEHRVKTGGKRHMPGDTVMLDSKEAESLLKAGAISKPGGESTTTSAPKNPYADWNKEKLVQEAEARELTVTRADEKDGDPLASDYEKALLAHDAAKTTT